MFLSRNKKSYLQIILNTPSYLELWFHLPGFIDVTIYELLEFKTLAK